MSTLRRILITGATGKQGGALLTALAATQSQTAFHLVALTRDVQSAKAQKLAKLENVSLQQGDLDDVSSIFTKAQGKFYGVFSVQANTKKETEETQGKALIDAAVANGVQHFIYSSVDRGGFERSNNDPTKIPHFQSKHNIEVHLKEVAKKSGGTMKWTILRPVAFMDNFTPDFIGRAMASMLELNGRDRKLQLVATKDIGFLAAEAFKFPETYESKAISLATDEISPAQADEIFTRVTGSPQPRTYSFVARLFKWFLQSDIGVMIDWFKDQGYGADPKAILKQYPGMQDFETWLSTSSGFQKK